MCSQGISQFYLHTSAHVQSHTCQAIAGTYLPTPEGWKAELAWVAGSQQSGSPCMNSGKYRVMFSGHWEGSADIRASGATIETVEDFCYLGSYISSTENCDQKIKVRIDEAAGIFSKLLELWKIKKTSLSVKKKDFMKH